jgi:cell division septation protein DedD
MRDQDRWKDRFELALDTKQVFVLFLVSALVLALVFSLGVIVGKRVEPARSVVAPTDPLALLDEMGGQAIAVGRQSGPDRTEPDLTFPDALGRPSKESLAAAEANKARSAQAASNKANPSEVAKVPRGKTAVLPGLERFAKAAKDDRALTAQPKKGAYSLQLSSFRDRVEAEQFIASLRQQGLRPQVVHTAIPGRGKWYRIRVGSYRNLSQALTAKVSFERASKDLAYIAKN